MLRMFENQYKFDFILVLDSNKQITYNNMDNSLIAGMPEVIAYIKKIEDENKELRKEVYTMGEGEEAHLCKIASLKREIDDLKEQGGNYQYDLEELQADLQPLDEFMDDLTGVCQYEDLIDYIKGIQENSVPKQILFAERQGAKDRYDIAIKQVNDLMKEVEKQKGINQMLMDAIEAKSE